MPGICIESEHCFSRLKNPSLGVLSNQASYNLKEVGESVKQRPTSQFHKSTHKT